MGDRGVQETWLFMCFLEVAKLEGPGRRRKPSDEGGEGRDLAIGGVGSVQRLFNRRQRAGPVIMLFDFKGSMEIGVSGLAPRGLPKPTD